MYFIIIIESRKNGVPYMYGNAIAYKRRSCSTYSARTQYAIYHTNNVNNYYLQRIEANLVDWRVVYRIK